VAGGAGVKKKDWVVVCVISMILGFMIGITVNQPREPSISSAYFLPIKFVNQFNMTAVIDIEMESDYEYESDYDGPRYLFVERLIVEPSSNQTSVRWYWAGTILNLTFYFEQDYSCSIFWIIPLPSDSMIENGYFIFDLEEVLA
jgi:hypothetical protein